jgi:putative PIG3 family NAD(P)H quinone oxidoreductase
MHAITVGPAPERDLLWTPLPDLTPGPGQVRLAVHATAVNRADLLQRQGRYPVPEGASPILGLEAAGVVDALGEGVEASWLGRRVCVLLEGGGYATQVVVDTGMLIPVPDAMSMEEAAALPEALYTVWTNIGVEAGLQPGQTLLLNAAASGVGCAAVQVARAWGCRVLATASAGKLGRVQALGAHAVRDRTLGELAAWVRGETDGRGADVVLDMVGGPALAAHLDALAPRGTLVLIGLLGGAQAEVPLGPLLMRRLRVVGSVLRSRSRSEKLALTEALLRDVWPMVLDGHVQPSIDAVMPIEEAGAAHALVASNRTVGKVVLRMSADPA